MRFKFLKNYNYSYDGIEVHHYQKNEVIESNDERFIKIATKDKAIKSEKADKSDKAE